MRYLDLTLPTAAENLALDEALLMEAEASDAPQQIMRLWECPSLAVVVGRSSKIALEVHAATCRREGIPILRRTSGGAAVVIGPGCLMYSLVLSLRQRPGLRAVKEAHRFVLGRISRALGSLVPGVRCCGTSDLAIGDQKFSGNSIRIMHDCLLYHGTLLYDFPLERIDRFLPQPPREPAYRNGRPHATFLTNLAVPADVVRDVLRAAWGATEPCGSWPEARTEKLVEERYGRPEWNEPPPSLEDVPGVGEG